MEGARAGAGERGEGGARGGGGGREGQGAEGVRGGETTLLCRTRVGTGGVHLLLDL